MSDGITDMMREQEIIRNDRSLYDFFDERGIRICTPATSTGFYIQMWITGKSSSLYMGESEKMEIETKHVKIFDSRSAAEECAFSKAFTMLNTKEP